MPATKLKVKGDLKQIEDIKKKFGDDIKIMVGLPKNSTPYPDGTSVVEVGSIHEFGLNRMPERSFLRSAIGEEQENIKKDLIKVAKNLVDGKEDIMIGARKVGTIYADKVMKKIIDIKTPPNSPQTIERKGSSNPLIDTGHLKSSVTYEVRVAENA